MALPEIANAVFFLQGCRMMMRDVGFSFGCQKQRTCLIEVLPGQPFQGEPEGIGHQGWFAGMVEQRGL